MTWTRALAYVAVWLVLTGYYVLTHRAAPPVEIEASRPQSPEPPPHLRLRAEEVVGLVIESGGRRVRAAVRGGQWFLVEPAGGRVSSDLVSALVSAVLDAAEVEVVSMAEDRDAEFGLDRPTALLTFERADGTTSRLSVGAKNPAQTAVYARGDGAPAIVLLGLNAEYYIGLVLQAAGPR
jgi:hypothetical protein